MAARTRKQRAPRKPRTKSAPPAALDPVTAYARDVVSRAIVAGLLVRLACARHLRDLEEQTDRGLLWKPEQAQVAIDFFQTVLCLPDEIDESAAALAIVDSGEEQERQGKPFLLSPFQQFIVGSVSGWHRADGRLRFRIGYFETAKGSGKTPLAAGMLLLRLLVLPGIGKQGYIAAVTRDQANLTFQDAANIVAASPAIRGKLEVTANSIAHHASGSFIRAISAEKRGLDGKRVDSAVSDEVHEQATNIVVEKMRAGIKNRLNALILLTTNSGFDRTTVCWELHEYSRKVLEGVITNDAWFAYVCQLDPCDACYAKGHRAPFASCPNCDQWHTEGPHWLKVNPNLGVSLGWEYLRDQVREALGMPGKQALVMRLNFCLWTEQRTIWIPSDAFDRCRVETLRAKNPERLRCAAGLDLSTTTDLTSCAIAIRHEDEPGRAPDVVEIVESDEAGEPQRKTLNLNFSVDLFTRFWMPKDKLVERVQKDHVPFDVWEKAKHLHTTLGPIVDYDAIYDEIVDELEPAYAIQQIGYDPYNATQFAIQLRDVAKLTVVEVKQGKILSEAAKLFHALVVSGRLRHNGNPVMAWCVSNAMAISDRFENLSIEKASSTQRIDGVIAALIALYLLVRLPAQRRKRGPARVWTPTGFKPVIEPATGDTHARA